MAFVEQDSTAEWAAGGAPVARSRIPRIASAVNFFALANDMPRRTIGQVNLGWGSREKAKLGPGKEFAMRKTALTLFVALGALCLPGTAFAEEVSARVGYDDLDLRDPADVKVLERRVKRAARSLCRAAATSALHPSTVDEVCFRDAAKRAVLEIERHRLRYAALDLGPAG